MSAGRSEEQMTADVLVAKAVAAHPRQFALAVAIVRSASNAIAALRGQETAADILREHSAKHRFRAARDVKSWGRRR